MEPTDLNDLRYFAEIMEKGSFTLAAQALGVQTSRLSRRVTALETELGVRLLNRTTRRISLTDAGKQFLQHCQAIMAHAQAAYEDVEKTRSAPGGVVRLSCPIGLLEAGMSKILLGYLNRYPEVRLMLDATNRRVDVIQEGLDLALRVRQGALADSELVIRQLWKTNTILVASPAFLKGHPRLTTLEQVAALPTLVMGNISERFEWTFYDSEGEAVSASHKPRLATDDLGTLRNAARAGMGVAELPRELVEPDLQSGGLLHVLPGLMSIDGIVHAVYPTRRGMVPAVAALLDVIASEFPNIWTRQRLTAEIR
ncbi:MAG TPA: LysR substrate-binding domain-containing protein [Gammaproteobacteria bacterium]|jgi:DNA-binding transcriptional LysR family regulator